MIKVDKDAVVLHGDSIQISAELSLLFMGIINESNVNALADILGMALNCLENRDSNDLTWVKTFRQLKVRNLQDYLPDVIENNKYTS